MTAEDDDCGLELTPAGGYTVADVGGAGARGIEGDDVSTSGATLTWTDGAAAAQAGDVVRVVRPTGIYDDYVAVAPFAAMTPIEKGREVHRPVGEAMVTVVANDTLTLDTPLAIAAGDVIYVGAPLALVDGQTSRAFAGAPGYTFARVMTDSGGAREVPNYRAIDIASDTRIPPGMHDLTSHRFALEPGCTTATVLYRPLPLALAGERGWTALDHVIATAEAQTILP